MNTGSVFARQIRLGGAYRELFQTSSKAQLDRQESHRTVGIGGGLDVQAAGGSGKVDIKQTKGKTTSEVAGEGTEETKSEVTYIGGDKSKKYVTAVDSYLSSKWILTLVGMTSGWAVFRLMNFGILSVWEIS